MKPRVIIDSHIPYAAGALEPHAEVHYLSGEAITRAVCLDADALVVRTRTLCNEQLLRGTDSQRPGRHGPHRYELLRSAWHKVLQRGGQQRVGRGPMGGVGTTLHREA